MLFIAAGNSIAGGSGVIQLGHTFLDETGNRSSDYRTYNLYEGTALTLDRFRYYFANGMHATFSGKNLTLNNRRLEGTVGKQSVFGITVTNSQYRRIYNFEGSKFTRRHNTTLSGYLSPLANVQLYGGGAWVGYRGNRIALFSLTDIPIPEQIDYTQNVYHAGVRLTDRGRSLNAEVRSDKFSDQLAQNRDQTRQSVRVQGILPIPQHEWAVLSGGYRYFTSKYDSGDTKFTAKTAWGSGSAELTSHWSVKYSFVFDRAGSELDSVLTDNLTNAVYLSYLQSRKANITAGYQYGINDDANASIRSTGWYASAWFAPTDKAELRGQLGIKAEDVHEGIRLVGDENRLRYRVSGKYRFTGEVSVRVSVENQHRENDDIDSKTDFVRFTGDASLLIQKITFTGSYAYGTGEYQNQTAKFAFNEHLLAGDLILPEWQKLQLSGGAVYYRSKQDLNIESFALRASVVCHVDQHYTAGVNYTADNFDDLTEWNEYYTANIVEIFIARDISF
jgi:hypothetical protein